MLHQLARPVTSLVERYLPDPYVFVLVLTFLVLTLASLITPFTPLQTLESWGDGFWSLLKFAMQMLMILVAGYMLASTPVCKRVLERLAHCAKGSRSAIVLVTLVAMASSWVNWGFGLVIGALFAKTLAKHVTVDYRVLVASAYSGFIVWHGGLSGSIPLTVATNNHFAMQELGVISTSETLFSAVNLIILFSLLVIMPFINTLLLPAKDEQVLIDKNLLNTDQHNVASITTPAQKLENSKLLGLLTGGLGCAYLLIYFTVNNGSLNLNSVIGIFLFLAILLHQTPANVLKSLQEGIQGGAGILIQFPFYAGIMTVMKDSGLAQQLSSVFVNISSDASLPFWSFLSAGLVNIFVPSGGGQWAVQAPIVIPAALELGADVNKVIMAVAWGDAWTNLIQPFWALPVLAIAGLKARDIMGFCLLQLLVSGVVIAVIISFV